MNYISNTTAYSQTFLVEISSFPPPHSPFFLLLLTFKVSAGRCCTVAPWQAVGSLCQAGSMSTVCLCVLLPP